MMYPIRKANKEDLSNIYSLFLKARKNLEDRGINMWSHGYPREEDFLADIESDCLYVMEDGDKIIATLGYFPDAKDYFFFNSKSDQKWEALRKTCGFGENEDCYVLERLIVDPDYKRQGLGRKMFFYLEESFAHANWMCAVFKENGAESFPFYEACGFTNHGESTEFEWRKPELCCYFSKRKKG